MVSLICGRIFPGDSRVSLAEIVVGEIVTSLKPEPVVTELTDILLVVADDNEDGDECGTAVVA